MSINAVTISGNLGRDPELRATRSGMQVLNFTVAVNERVKDASGQYTDYANWVSCVMFGRYAETMSKYLQKGSKVCASGRLRYSSWEKDGQRHSKMEVIVSELELMSSRDQSKPVQAQQPTTQGYDVYDEEIPF